MRPFSLVFLLACGGRHGHGGADETVTDADTDTDTDADTDTDTDSDTDADTDTDTEPIEVPADNVTNVLGDCEGAFREPDAYPNQLIAGDELHRYFLKDPEAVCNDGTRAVLYVRAATDETLANVWSLHLQGGGACSAWEDCAVRWCGTGYYDASKMSSAYAPEQVGAVGIYDADRGNVLAGANQVYFYYCSSDTWAGDGSWSLTPEDGTQPAYTMFTRGHRIVASAIDELEAGVVADDGEELPTLTDATYVLFSGTSGGSLGAQAHADWLTDRVSPTPVWAIFDAANNPFTSTLPADLQPLVDEAYRASWDEEIAKADYVPFVDETCLAAYQGTGDEYLCDEPQYVVANHITTPFFMRQDLRDVTELAEAAGMAEYDYEVAVHDTLRALADIPSTGVEGDDMTRTPGAYGPNCAQHVALETTDWWRVATVEDDDGTPTTFQAAAIAWFEGDDVSIVDEATAADGVDGPRSVCASTDDEH